MLIDDARQDLYGVDRQERQYMGISVRGLENLEALATSRVHVLLFYPTGSPFYHIMNILETLQPNSVMRGVSEYYIYKVDICL